MAFAEYLNPQELTELYNASIRTGLANPMMLGTLLAGINPYFAAILPMGLPPNAQLLTTLDKLNKTERLTDGSVPFQLWLSNAVKLVGPVEDAKTFTHALSQVTQRASGAPSIPNVETLPERKERIVHQDDMVPISFFSAGAAAGQSVAHIRVPRYDAGAPRQLPGGGAYLNVGTVWLITRELAVTNHHVVNAREQYEPPASLADLELQTTQAQLYFDYDDPARLPTAETGLKLEAFDVALDYAILRLPRPNPRSPLRLRTEELAVHTPVNIIQHPMGKSKRVACRNNLVTAVSPTELRYFTDTELGSSGSPVFDDSWRVVALHCSSVDVHDVSFQGKSTAWVNVGITLGAILKDLQQRAPALWREIQSGQTP